MWDAPGKQRRAGDWEWGQGGWGSLLCRVVHRHGALRRGSGRRRHACNMEIIADAARSARAWIRWVPARIGMPATRYNSHSHVPLQYAPYDPPPDPPHLDPATVIPIRLYAPPPRHADGAPPTYLPPPPSLPGAPSSVAAALAAPSPWRQRQRRRPFARLPPPLLVHPFPAPGCPCFRGASPSALAMVNFTGHRRWGGCGGG